MVVVKYKKVNLYTGLGVYKSLSDSSDVGWYTPGNRTFEYILKYHPMYKNTKVVSPNKNVFYSFEKDDSEYYAGIDSGFISMYQVYNAFTQVLTDGMKKDPFNIFEKTLLLRDILGL